MIDEQRDAAIEDFRERAAIMEYDGELPRANAESLALQEVVRIYGKDAGREVQRWREGKPKVKPRKASACTES